MSDLISRPAAIKAIEDLTDCYNGFSSSYDKACIIGVLQELPSAEQRKGKWIERQVFDSGGTVEELQSARCSVCGGIDMGLYLYGFTKDDLIELLKKAHKEGGYIKPICYKEIEAPHGRLIDVECLQQEFEDSVIEGVLQLSTSEIISTIDDAPTVIEAEE